MKNGSSLLGVVLSAAGIVLLGLIFGFSKPVDPALRMHGISVAGNTLGAQATP
jgi:hypothetical protein